LSRCQFRSNSGPSASSLFLVTVRAGGLSGPDGAAANDLVCGLWAPVSLRCSPTAGPVYAQARSLGGTVFAVLASRTVTATPYHGWAVLSRGTDLRDGSQGPGGFPVCPGTTPSHQDYDTRRVLY